MYDDVAPPGAVERESWKRLPFDEAEFLRKEVGATELTGEAGLLRAGARVGAAHHGGSRHRRRIHRRWIEDRDPIQGGRQSELSPGAESGSRENPQVVPRLFAIQRAPWHPH